MDNLLIACGVCGVALSLISYYQLTTGKWDKYSSPYLLCNFFACVGLTLSLIVQFNIAALFINVAWAAIAAHSFITKTGDSSR